MGGRTCWNKLGLKVRPWRGYWNLRPFPSLLPSHHEESRLLPRGSPNMVRGVPGQSNSECRKEELHYPVTQRLKAKDPTDTQPPVRLFCELSALNPHCPQWTEKETPSLAPPCVKSPRRKAKTVALPPSFPAGPLPSPSPTTVALPFFSWFLGDRNKSDHLSQPAVCSV